MNHLVIYGFLSAIVVTAYGDGHADMLNGCTVENLQNGLDYCLMEIGDTIVEEDWYKETLSNGTKPSFDIYIEITYNVDEYSFDACQDTIKIPKTSTVVVPGDIVTASYTYMEPVINLPTRNGVSLADKWYTLIAMDVNQEEDDGDCGTSSHPLVYWLKNNVDGNNLNNGYESLGFRGAVPRDMYNAKMVFLLFEQVNGMNDHIDSSVYTPDSVSCSHLAFDNFDVASRAMFDLAAFASSDSLKLVSASWYSVMVDEYAINFWLSYDSLVGLSYEEHLICCWINICCWEPMDDGTYELCTTAAGAPTLYSVSAFSAVAASTSALCLK